MQYNDEKKEKLDRLEKKLYSRNAPDIIDAGRTQLKDGEMGRENGANENWQEIKTGSFDQLATKISQTAQKKHDFVKKIFAASLIFFTIALGAAIFVFWGGGNLVSSKNVDVKVIGPLSVGGGQEVSFDINVINNNNIDLLSASLLVEYPEGTRSVTDLSKGLDRERFVLQAIRSGESYNQNIKAVFFGEKDSLKQIKISLEYRVENSSATFYKEKLHEISISSAPIIITPTYPKEVNSNQEMFFNIEVASNSKDKMEDFLVSVEYPFGFIFKDSTPKAFYSNNVWKFSNLNSGEKRTITIKGNVVGQDNEEKVFRLSAGSASKDDERTIAVPLSQLTESVLVKKPFIGIGVFIDGKAGDVPVRGGNQVNTELTVQNNLSAELFNVSVLVAFKGGAFNRLSVVPSNDGFFQSFNDTIIWDKKTVGELSEMGSGTQKKLSFRLSPFLYANMPAGAKPEIEITVSAKGERISESGSIEKISALETRKIILATDLSLSSKTVRSIGNLENSGPIPPKVNVPTTYTIVWGVSNSFNQASNVEVKATLPTYVKWTGNYSPTAEVLSYNQITNEVVWNAGSILPNTGFGSPKKEIYFQLEFLPSSSQIGQTPAILNESSISGIDKATGLKVESKSPPATVNFSGDPSYRTKDDKVVQ